MKPRSFFLRLFLGNLLLIGVIIAAAGIVFYRSVNQRVYRADQAAQHDLLRLAQHHFEATWPPAVAADTEAFRRLMPGPEMRLTVVDAEGKVLLDSWADPAGMANHKTPDRKEILDALAGRDGQDVRPSETLKTSFRYLAMPVRRGDQVAGAVRVAMAVRAIAEHEGFVLTALLWAGAGAVALAVVLALLVSWVWSRPLAQITHAARKIAAGNLTYRAQISGSAELSQLGTALNEMRDSLARQISLAAAQRQNFQTAVANLREGVVAVGPKGRIMLMNQSAGELLASSADQAAGQHFQAVINLVEVVQLFHDVLQTRQGAEREIECELQGRRRILHAQAIAVPPAAGNEIAALLVVRDMTEQARTAAMKAEFVANASHELRTPLATIRAAVESLESVAPDDREALGKFVAILGRHVARLENMTKDLLDLHLVERARGKLRLEEIAPGAIVQWTQGQFAAAAGDKGVRLEVRAAGSDAPFRGDWMLLQLIVQNLVDNAIKFTAPGGSVQCVVEGQDGQVVLRVADTGCGIPPAMQERVFERFFQADASRSGQPAVRGTGLGLAIVKHAADRLGAKISLQSDVDRGTTVTVQVPKR